MKIGDRVQYVGPYPQSLSRKTGIVRKSNSDYSKDLIGVAFEDWYDGHNYITQSPGATNEYWVHQEDIQLVCDGFARIIRLADSMQHTS